MFIAGRSNQIPSSIGAKCDNARNISLLRSLTVVRYLKSINISLLSELKTYLQTVSLFARVVLHAAQGFCIENRAHPFVLFA